MRSLLASLCTFVCLAASVASAQIPDELNHQGLLVGADGLPMQGQVTLDFALYQQLEGGDVLWSEQYQVLLVDGYYYVPLGAQQPIGAAIEQGARYLGVRLNGAAQELSPRQLLRSVPFALSALNAVGDITPTSVTVGPNLVVDADGNLEARSVWVGGAMVIDADRNWVGRPIDGGGGAEGYSTPEQVVAALLGVDGPGSGVDADLLDGLDSDALLLDAAELLALLLTVDGPGSGIDADSLDGYTGDELLRRPPSC